MQYKYISDLHINDLSIFDWRPQFTSMEQFIMTLIPEWNAYTEKDDIVIIVGDVGTYCPSTINVLNHLNGRKVLVTGNHDMEWGVHLWDSKVFQGVYDSLDMNGIHIEHTPQYTSSKYKYFVHGHHHLYNTAGMYKAFKSYAADIFRLNCSADILHFHPSTLQELILAKELLLEEMSA